MSSIPRVLESSHSWVDTARDGVSWCIDKVSAIWQAVGAFLSTYGPIAKDYTIKACIFLKKWTLIGRDFATDFYHSHPGEVHGALFMLAVVMAILAVKRFFAKDKADAARE